jgi:demethylmenaquinone methyltransferase/2-methoxy-6-polyprenyl-1,4-benzoquinol methylase
MAESAAPGAVDVLDACCGTGDFSLALLGTFGPGLNLTGADLSEAMLSLAKKRLPRAVIVTAEAKNLPFPDASFDLVTISFATRNLNLDRPRLLEALREFRRVLKPGGVFLNLETTRPPYAPLWFLMRLYVRAAIGLLNALSPKNRSSYSFLRNTILNFYGPEEFSALLAEAGFSAPAHTLLFPGAAAVHSARN